MLVVYSFNPEGTATLGSAVALALLWAFGTVYSITTRIGFWACVLLALFGLILIVATLGVGAVTKARFRPFAASVFVAAIAYTGALSFLKAEKDHYAQPVAALKAASGHGLRGIYVADNDDFIYIGLIRKGRPHESPSNGVPLYRLPRIAESRTLIGDSVRWWEAKRQSRLLLKELKSMPRAQQARARAAQQR